MGLEKLKRHAIATTFTGGFRHFAEFPGIKGEWRCVQLILYGNNVKQMFTIVAMSLKVFY